MAEVPLVAIVDDDASALAAEAGLIRALGFAATGFSTAAAFLASDALSLAVCVVADVRMPDMGGFELLRRLVSLDRPVPTVLATAFPDAVERSRALTWARSTISPSPFAPRTCFAVYERQGLFEALLEAAAPYEHQN